jgi:hypothetical protein
MPRHRPAHRRAAEQAEQQAYIVFGGEAADLPWLRPLRRGFRHCFAALQDTAGWLVLDPLCGRLLAARMDLAPGFDLPGFYRRAGFAVLGPFRPMPAGPRWCPNLAPMTCVGVCRAVLGSDAPFALTPWGLFLALSRKKSLTREETSV